MRDWSARFKKNPLAASVVAGLDKHANEIWDRTFRLLVQESAEYRNAVDEEFTSESREHCKQLLFTIVAIAKGRIGRADPDRFAFVRAHAEWRARHQVPLVASLRAYQLAHKTYSGIAKDVLLRNPRREETIAAFAMLSDFWIEFFDHVGSILAEAHAAEEERTVGKSTPVYAALIDDLLRGTEPSDPAARRLRILCGIRPDAPLAVAVARLLPSPDKSQLDVDAARRSLVRLIQHELPTATFGKLAAIRNDEVIAIVCSESSPGLGLSKVLRQLGLGRRSHNTLVLGVGVSRDTLEISALPQALEEARLALEFATPMQKLKHFHDIDLAELLVRRADEIALRAIPDSIRRLIATDGANSRELCRTIRAFASCNLNVKQTAQYLKIHANTVYFRLNRIEKQTGTDPRTFSGISSLLMALRLLEIEGASQPGGLAISAGSTST